VTPRTVATASIYWGAVPFMILQLFVMAALIAAPPLVVQPKLTSSDAGKINVELPPPPSDPDGHGLGPHAFQRATARALRAGSRFARRH